MAHEGADPEHALLERPEEAHEVSSFRDDGCARARVGRLLPRGRPRASGALARRAGRDPRRASRRAARRGRAVLRGPRRSRRDPAARAHALAEPALLRVLRDDGCGAGRARRAPHRRPQPGRDPLAHVAGAAGARGAHGRLAAAARRPARRSSAVTSRTPPRRAFSPRVVVARTLQPDRRVLVCSEHAHSARGQGRAAPRARAAQGADGRRVPAPAGPARAPRTPARSSRRSGRRG